MRVWLTVAFGLSLSVLGCVESVPDRVVLDPKASDVEVVSEPPNPAVYEPVGEVSAQVIGRESPEAFRQAFNMLRNQGAKKGATFVSIDDVSSRAAWDLSGRTVVSVVGTAYRPK